MVRRPAALTWLAALLLVASAPAQDHQPGALFDAVAKTLKSQYYDKTFRREQLPELVAMHRAAALRAADLDEERLVVDALLRHVPASHLALYSKHTHDRLWAELGREDRPTFGCELEQIAGQFFVTGVLEGGPAELAGLRRGDRVIHIDDQPPGASVRLDRSSDDAYLPDRPRHMLRGDDGDRAVFTVQRARDAAAERVEVQNSVYSSWRASQASVRVIEVDGVKVGYVHYWFVYIGGVTDHFKKALKGPLADCAAYVVDLRGRGGDGISAQTLVTTIAKLERPCVALIDRNTRSAKEVIAFELRKRGAATLVGEHTARAVIPATFKPVGDEDVLMFPSYTLGQYTKDIELQGVAPHVVQADQFEYAAGGDVIAAAGLREAARLATIAR